MRQKLFSGKNYEKRCEYCLKGRLPQDRSAVLCKRFGVVALDFSCRSFEYDPLKRTPRRIRVNASFDESEFKL